jgi:hypothetical protein
MLEFEISGDLPIVVGRVPTPKYFEENNQVVASTLQFKTHETDDHAYHAHM